MLKLWVMNILASLKNISLGRIMRWIALEEPTMDYLLYLESSRVFGCILSEKDSPEAEAFRVQAPLRTKFGSPLSSPCDLSRSEDYFRQYLSPMGVKRHSRLHVIADIPVFAKAWKFESGRLAAEVIRELTENASEMIPAAPEGYRWFLCDMHMRPLNGDEKVDEAVLVGMPDDICLGIVSWASEMGCTVVSICPLALLSISRCVRLREHESEYVLFWSAVSKTRFIALLHSDGGIQSIEHISAQSGMIGEAEKHLGFTGQGTISSTVLLDGASDAGMFPKLPQGMNSKYSLVSGLVTREDAREIFMEYAFAIWKGGLQ